MIGCNKELSKVVIVCKNILQMLVALGLCSINSHLYYSEMVESNKKDFLCYVLFLTLTIENRFLVIFKKF